MGWEGECGDRQEEVWWCGREGRMGIDRRRSGVGGRGYTGGGVG